MELKTEVSNVEKMANLYKFRRELRKLKQLDIYGFNSAKFDLPTLAGPLLLTLQETGKVNILKKRNSYIAISTEKFIFKDVLKFHSPCTYEKFVSLWATSGAKSIWPHNFFNSIEEINSCKTFPKRSDFASKLHEGSMPDIQSYIIAKREFYRRKLLAKSDPNRIRTMRGFLRYYNIQDVKPLATAIMNCFASYSECFSINPHAELSLPSIALKAMEANFKKDSPLVFTFSEDERKIADIFRDRVFGGLTNVYHRHVRLFDSAENIPERAKFAKSGDRFTAIISQAKISLCF